MIYKAFIFGAKKHEGQKDDLGKDYFTNHCLQVLKILREVTKDENVLMAGLLHDTLEDTDTTYNELKKEFGGVIADLVNEVTQEGEKDEKGFYFPRLHSKDAILIKFADRLSNMSRMHVWNEKRQAQYLRKSKFWRGK